MKKQILIAGIVLTLFILNITFLAAEQVFTITRTAEDFTEIEFYLDDYELILTEAADRAFYRVSHPEAVHLMHEGLPELPVFSFSIAIPNTGNAELQESRILETEILGNIAIFPSQGADYDKLSAHEFLYDENFYLKDKLFPASVSEIGTPAVMRDIRFVSVAVTPFRYNPVKGELEVNRHIRLRIEHNPYLSGENEINRPQRKRSRSFEKIYRSTLLNYDDFLDPNWEYQARSILVVYHHNATLEPIVNAFVNWKRQKGFEITATNTQMLNSNNAIKNYIQNAYDNWENPPEYVILIGGGQGSFSIPPFNAHPNTAGDHPYSLLDGNDNISDVFVGRFPIYSQEHLLTMWTKIRNYEKDPFIGNMNWYSHALLVGSPTGWGISTLFTMKYAKELMLLYNPNFNFSEVYYSPIGTQITNALNQGTFLFNYRGYYAFDYSWSSSDGNIANGLMLPNCFFLTCNTLNYNINQTSSETERFVVLGSAIQPKGGVSAIGVNTLESKTAYNNLLSGAFTYGIYNEGIRTMGETLVRGKIFLHQTFGIVHPTHPPQFSHWVNLMGDPSMDIWVDKPKMMNVSYDEVLPLGANYLEVTVTNEFNQSVENAWVTLRQGDDDIFVTGYTGPDGTITHLFDPNNSGEVTITVTKPDHLPHIGTFDLTGEASVSLESMIVNDPLEAGNNVSLLLTVKNHRTDHVYALSGTISSNSPYVDIQQATSAFGNISPGNTSESNELFMVSLSHAAPNLIPIMFNLELADATGNTWQSKFTLRISSNTLKPTALITDDNNDYIEPGQTSPLRITLENVGLVDAEQIYGILRSKNPLFDVSDSLAFFGDIEAGGSSTSMVSNSFVVTAFESLITGMTIDLELVLYNYLGFETIEQLQIPIGLVSVNDPLGPCDYGYYIYGMEDTDYEYAPTYDWIEIAPQLGGSGQNTGLQADYNNNQGIVTADLPFSFRFYGIDYDTITISANGWISFGETQQGTFRNSMLPGPLGPNPMVAAFWDNLSLSQGGVYTYADPANEFYVIQWQNARNLIASAEETFQIILNNPATEPTIDEGFIKIQYKTFNNVNNSSGYPNGNWGNFCTAGIGDHTGNSGLTYTFANQYPTAAGSLSHHSAIMIVGPENYGEPFLVRQSVAFFDENSTGQIDAGENVKLGIYIRNIGHATATDVTGTITTSSPYVYMRNNSSPYYDILSGTEEVNREFFDFDVLGSVPNNYTMDFEITLQSSTTDFSFPFHLEVSKPNLQLSSYMINETEGNGNGIPDPGENIFMVLGFTNPSNTEVKDANLSLNTDNIFLTINTPQLDLGNIPPQASIQKAVSITITDNCPEEQVVSFNLDVSGNNILGFHKELYFGVTMDDVSLNFAEYDGSFSSNDPDGWQYGEPGNTGFSDTNVWATALDSNYANSANWTLDTPGFLITPTTELSFQHLYIMENYWDGGNVKITTDDGLNWQIVHPAGGYPVSSVNSGNSGIPNQPAFSGNSNGWQEAVFDLSQHFGKLARFRWHFGSGPWVNEPGWLINEFHLNGINSLSAVISGNIDLIQSPYPVDTTIITAGDYAVKPDNNGNYDLVLPPGTYDISASLPHHFSDLSYELTVEELTNTTGIDFSLQFLTPPTNLEFILHDNNITVDLSWQYEPLIPSSRNESPQGFETVRRGEKRQTLDESVTFVIYRQKDSGFFQQIGTTEELYYTDLLPVSQSLYSYFIVAVYPEGESATSNIVNTGDSSNSLDDIPLLPQSYSLRQNYPNPFNPVTNISFSLPVQEKVVLNIYNIKGELVANLVEDTLPAGDHNIQWQGTNNNNRPVGSGIYFYDLRAGNFRETRKALLLK
jgi:hypothetical protein